MDVVTNVGGDGLVLKHSTHTLSNLSNSAACYVQHADKYIVYSTVDAGKHFSYSKMHGWGLW